MGRPYKRFMKACRRGNLDTLDNLLKRNRFSENDIRYDGMQKAIDAGRVDVVDYLIKKINFEYAYLWSMIDYVCNSQISSHKNAYAIVKSFLKWGACHNCRKINRGRLNRYFYTTHNLSIIYLLIMMRDVDGALVPYYLWYRLVNRRVLSPNSLFKENTLRRVCHLEILATLYNALPVCQDVLKFNMRFVGVWNPYSGRYPF